MRLASRRFLAARAAMCVVLAMPSISSAQAAMLRGSVLSAESGRPVPNAIVSLASQARETRTDSLGRFTLGGLRAGDHELVVQAVGYSPARATVPLSDAAPLELDIDLDPLGPVLDSVVIEADLDAPRNAAMADFESRRALGFGRFITRSDLLKSRGRTLDAVLGAKVPGLRLVNVNGSVLAASGRGSVSILTPVAGRCLSNVVVDGTLRYTPGGSLPPFDLRSLEASMIAAVEFYTPASTPAEFNWGGNAPCGTLVIWMQN